MLFSVLICSIVIFMHILLQVLLSLCKNLRPKIIEVHSLLPQRWSVQVHRHWDHIVGPCIMLQLDTGVVWIGQFWSQVWTSGAYRALRSKTNAFKVLAMQRKRCCYPVFLNRVSQSYSSHMYAEGWQWIYLESGRKSRERSTHLYAAALLSSPRRQSWKGS